MLLDKTAHLHAASTARPPETNFAGIHWEISATPSGTSMLRLAGDLKPGWLGRLATHLSTQKINILGGTARKISPLRWESVFEISSSRNYPGQLKDFNPLPAVMGTGAAPQSYLPAPGISGFTLERSANHGGCLYVEIRGRDCIGFLSGILSVFSFYSLFPIEMELSTAEKAASDRFWLKGIGASVPIDDDIAVLSQRLETMRERTD